MTKQDTKTKQLKEDQAKLNQKNNEAYDEALNEIWQEISIIGEELDRLNNIMAKVCDRMGLE